jgi:hypothetical protein
VVTDYDEGDPEVQVVDHLARREDEGLNNNLYILHFLIFSIVSQEKDVNIWEDTNKTVLFGSEKDAQVAEIKAASLNGLIEVLTEKDKQSELEKV